MKKKIIKKIITTSLIVCMLVPCTLCGYKNVYGVTSQDLQDVEDQKAQKQSDLDAKKNEIEELRQKSSNTESLISSLDGMITELDTALYNLQIQITDLESQITTAEEGLVKAEEVKNEQYEAMKLRIQYMYEHNDESYVALLLTAQSMGEMLNRVEYISKISEYDRNMLEKYQETMDYIATTKEELVADYAEMFNMQDSLEEQKESLAYLQGEKIGELVALNSLQEEAQNQQSLIESDLSALDAQTEQIEAQMKAQEAAAAAAAAGGGSASLDDGGKIPSYDGGMFKWPTVNTKITSDYGDSADRSAPHKGIDVAPTVINVSGDPIYACYDGTVVYATYDGSWNGGAGNWVVIYHGNGLYTRYLHCSAVFASVGQQVTKGDTIALMGTTGDSTGVHLHFDVRLNGSYVNPWNYFG